MSSDSTNNFTDLSTTDQMSQLAPVDQSGSMDMEAARQVEDRKLTRRAALRKLGFGAGVAAFSLLGVDDFARMVGQRLQRQAGDNRVAQAVAQEFQQAGITLANPTGAAATAKCPYPCAQCGTFYAKQTNDIQKCQAACGDCCTPTSSGSLPCGLHADGDVTTCQQACATYFGQSG